MFSTRFKLTWDESVAQFAEELPWTLISFAIGVGSCLALWLILYISDCCFVSKAHSDVYVRRTRRCGKSAGRLFILLFAIFVATVGFWIACNTAGVSFWNILFAYGILTLVVSVAFNAGLANLGAYIMIAMTNAISEDMYVEFIGMPVEGRIVEINILAIKMEWFDAATKRYRIRTVPTVYFISSAWDRNIQKEEEREASTDAVTTVNYGINVPRAGLKKQK